MEIDGRLEACLILGAMSFREGGGVPQGPAGTMETLGGNMGVGMGASQLPNCGPPED